MSRRKSRNCCLYSRVKVRHTTPEIYNRLLAQKKRGIRVGGYNSSPSTLSYGQPESRNGESAESNESQIILICYFVRFLRD